MIGGIYHDPKFTASDKVPCFFLPNKIQFHTSIGHNYENVLNKNKCITEEIIIFGYFCELVGPVPLLVHPSKHQIKQETIDMIVLKAMSVDYQSCEHGDFVLDTTTQTLVLDCSIPFFAHYFTLWDIYARGYVRPCCLIVCCRDKTRAREIFISTHISIVDLLKPFLADNVAHFYQELLMSKEIIDKMLILHRDNPLMINDEFDSEQLVHLQNEYGRFLSNILKQVDSSQITNSLKSGDLLLDISLATVSIKRELRPIYAIMKVNEIDVINLLASISKMFNDSKVSESFSLTQFDSLKDINLTLFNPAILDHDSKFNINYFYTALMCDKNFLSVTKTSSVCLCKKLYDNVTVTDETPSFDDLPLDTIFPNLQNIKTSQCHFVSYQCKQLGLPIVMKLIASLFNQCNLIVFINTQQSYLHFMSFLLLFLPKAHNLNYFTYKMDWPTFEQLKESPVFMLNKETKSNEMPSYLQGFVAIYDYTTTQFISGPKYCKGHLSNFLDSFKYLEFNHLHLDTILNIMLLNYVDMIYQWSILLGKRDRRWICDEYLIKLGYSQEDIIISENLALFVLQTLAKSKRSSNETNLFLTSKSLCHLTNLRKDK